MMRMAIQLCVLAASLPNHLQCVGARPGSGSSAEHFTDAETPSVDMGYPKRAALEAKERDSSITCTRTLCGEERSPYHSERQETRAGRDDCIPTAKERYKGRG